MPIYTRTGDKGTTSLFGGTRVLKCDGLVDAYGSIDEVNSLIGLLKVEINDSFKDIKQNLTIYQNDLFVLGSSLAGWKKDVGFIENRVKEMEAVIDNYEKHLPELQNFILPGGSRAGALAHVARSVTRRVERQLVALRKKQPFDPRIIMYFNRLSDLLFDLARYLNFKDKKKEDIWFGISKTKSTKKK